MLTIKIIISNMFQIYNILKILFKRNIAIHFPNLIYIFKIHWWAKTRACWLDYTERKCWFFPRTSPLQGSWQIRTFPSGWRPTYKCSLNGLHPKTTDIWKTAKESRRPEDIPASKCRHAARIFWTMLNVYFG